MTASEWLTCHDRALMLSLLRERGLLSSRKQVLLACADAGPAMVLQDPHYAVAERFVDGKASTADLDASLGSLEREEAADPHFWDRFHNTHADEVFRRRYLLEIARGKENLLDLNPGELPCHPFDPRYQGGDLIREIFGNPFRTAAVDPAWLTANERAVARLAELVYEERAFERLPILADALEDAGCDNADLLAHLRGAGKAAPSSPPHTRGCWAVDLLLGRK